MSLLEEIFKKILGDPMLSSLPFRPRLSIPWMQMIIDVPSESKGEGPRKARVQRSCHCLAVKWRASEGDWNHWTRSISIKFSSRRTSTKACCRRCRRRRFPWTPENCWCSCCSFRCSRCCYGARIFFAVDCTATWVIKMNQSEGVTHSSIVTSKVRRVQTRIPTQNPWSRTEKNRLQKSALVLCLLIELKIYPTNKGRNSGPGRCCVGINFSFKLTVRLLCVFALGSRA